MEDQEHDQHFEERQTEVPRVDERTEAETQPAVRPEATDSTPQQQQPERQNSREQQQRQHGRDRRNRPPQQRQQGGGRREGPRPHDGGTKEVSIIVPLYNEEQSLRELYDQIRSAVGRMGRYEIIFVDDGSSDGSMRILHELRNRDRRVKIIRFRRNFGKSAALSVGFANAEGNIVITMDADLQDDPGEIPNLISEIKKGYDLVSGWKKKRRDPITKTIPSKFFNFVTSLLTGIKIHDFNCGLKAYRKEVVKEVKIYGELHRYIPVLAHWLGYKIGEIQVQHRARKYGKTKFGIGRFWKGFLDLLTALFTTRYMQRPLHLFGFWGMVFFLAGFLVDLYLAILKVIDGLPLGNRPLFFGGILLIIVGVQFVSVGLLGEMISKTRQSADREYSVKEFWK
jgi:glycosyltransferase involved in cell wall biosynthesis